MATGVGISSREDQSFVVSVALFAASAIAFEWNKRRGETRCCDATQDVDCASKLWYSHRKRLSFHELSEAYPATSGHELPRNKSPSPEEEADFYPKDSNWSHFETYNASHDFDTYRPVKRSSIVSDLATVESFEGDLLFTSGGDTSEEEVSLSSKENSWAASRFSSPEVVDQKTLETIPSGRKSLPQPRSRRFISRSRSFDDTKFSNVEKDSGTARALSTPTQSSSKVYRLPNDTARANYNAKIMPDKVMLVRHGQSMGNIDESLYSTTADNAMPLTKLGWEQAKEAGKLLRESLLDDSKSVHFIVSPYVRTMETFHGIVSAWCDPSEFSHIADENEKLQAWYGRLLDLGLTWHEDVRLREQDFGNFQDPARIKKAKADRNQFGAFYYRFPHGESACDVFDRMSTFLDSLWRSFSVNKSRNYVIVTHGISIRVLLARYFRYTIEQFHLLSNPRNCEIVRLEHDGAGRLQLAGRHELHCKRSAKNEKDEVVDGYKFSKKLRVIPSQYVNKAKVRIMYE